ncbi:MAG: CinA family nicotinamide mononucleotide deamidase-related protein [Planctomycetes bacterium]|nr:CinA family nicotinamide mononucleotide deamidase-related protein [Planctomycetota bacterium]
MTTGSIAAEVLAIGDELAQGWNVDTNSAEIARELLAIGARVRRFTVITDERPAIARAIAEAAARSEVVIITGGLGPTDDDLTREGAADALGVELEFVGSSWAAIQDRLRKRGRPVPESNKKQAYRPAGADTIVNENGTAPGFVFSLGRARFFALPGVPREMRAMLRDSVLPEICKLFPNAIKPVRRVLKCFGAAEATIGEVIKPWMAARDADPLVGITVSSAVHTISILSNSAARADAAADAIAASLGKLVFARENASLEEVVARKLISLNLTIACAESCTGGLVASLLTNVPGVSAALLEGFVTYSNEAKTARLGVDPEILRSHGAVSAECAAAMALGASARAGSRVAVATTGIAGPDGGTAAKPVGLVWFAVAFDGRVETHERNYAGLERNFLREIASREALNLLRLAIAR